MNRFLLCTDLNKNLQFYHCHVGKHNLFFKIRLKRMREVFFLLHFTFLSFGKSEFYI